MAIIIESNPGTFFSAHGDLIFTVFEAVKATDPVTYPDYKYVCDIYVGATMVARLKAVPRPDNKRGVFNVSNIIRNYLLAVLNPVAPAFAALRCQQQGSGEFFITTTMKFGEEYGFTLFTDLTIDADRTYFDHYNGRMFGQNTILSDYVGKPLTVRPYQNYVKREAVYCFLPYMPYSTSGPDNNLQIVVYRSDGSPIVFLGGGFIAPTTANTLQQFNVSPTNLIAQFPGAVPADAAYYTVTVVTPNAPDDPIYRFDLLCEPRYEIFTIHFLNRFGGFESRDFTKVSRKSVEIEKEEFGRLPYKVEADGSVSYYTANKVYHESRSVYSSQFKEKITLNTDILTDAEYLWLADLVLSPLVYIEMQEYFLPVVITGSSYEFRKTINDKLTNLTLNIEFGDQFNAQYR